MNDICDIERYSRSLIIDEIGFHGQEKLKKANVLIIGAGGIGVPVAQNLCAMGVGKIQICDYDKIELHNLQRQLIFKEKDIGKEKAKILCHELQERNSSIEINYYEKKVDVKYLNNLLNEKKSNFFDVIIDATDDITSRLLVNDFCVKNKIPLVIGAIEKFSYNVFFINGFGACYRCFFDSFDNENLNKGCDKIGVYTPIVSICGGYMTNFVVKHILGMGIKHNFISGDLLNMTTNGIIIKNNILCNTCK